MSIDVNFVDVIRQRMRWVLARFGSDCTYRLNDGSTATLRAWVRRVRSDDLFAAAMQQDIAAIIDAANFKIAFEGRTSPARFDRLITPDGRIYTVEEHGGSPQANPVFFKVLIRGGQQ